MNLFKGMVGVLVACVVSSASAQPLDFEDLTTGTQFVETDTFTTGGFDVDVLGFLAGETPTSGFVGVENGNQADGLANDTELQVNNVTLRFNVGAVTLFSFLFGEYGGEVNLQINGDFRKLADFDDVDGMMVGGALISSGPAGAAGSAFTASGTINEIIIGGQELFIDDVRFNPVPSPSTAAIAGLGVLMMNQRRRRTGS